MSGEKRRAAVVTGAASGIGEATAAVFAANGYGVVLVDLTPDGETVAKSIRTDGHDAIFIRADVSSSEEVAAAVDVCSSEYGRLDSLVNCAGIDGAGEKIVEISDTDLDRVMAVNLKGTLYAMQHAVRFMKDGGGGAIVNISSTAAAVGLGRLGAYTASKGAVLSMSRVAAVELGRHNIRVNVICPGMVRTGMLAKTEMFDVAALERSVQRNPLPKVADPGEIAAAALFLGSPASSFMTGAVVMVDGGMTAI